MTEQDARERASRLARQTGQPVYVFTHRNHPGEDYDVAGNISGYPQATVVHIARPDGTFSRP